MYQIKQKYSHADVPKSTKGHPGSFYDSNFRQVEPSRSGRVHGQRLNPASTYKAAQAWSKTYQTCGAGTTMQSLDHGVQQSTLTYVPQPRIPRRDSGGETKKDAFIAIHMLDIQHYIRIVPTLTASSVMCAETAMKYQDVKMTNKTTSDRWLLLRRSQKARGATLTSPTRRPRNCSIITLHTFGVQK